ncbi:FAD-dependent oxidoreductase [Candidatus Spongiisocius sp.]|uniref:oxidoreductase n=1 Tax=Candidatus Spongiisocius sp. TaxID=3101273 RepID=UPI003B59E956
MRAAQNSYPTLFSSLRLGTLELSNRILLSPMTTGFGFRAGLPTEQLIEYFAARAQDVGMAVVAFGAVAPEGRVEQQIPWMWLDGASRALAPLAAAIAANGAAPCLQLGHGGRQVSPKVIGGDPVAPSAIAPLVHVSRQPRSLEISEVEDLITAFAAAARKASAAGFVAVEVHAGHGYLIHQFMSAGSNRRDDAYGGETVAARARFGVEIVGAIKEAVPELAVMVRLNGADFVPGGLEVADAVVAARSFASAGADGLVVSAGVYGSVPYTIPLLDDPEGTFLDLASQVRVGVDIPVVAVGRITDPSTAEMALASGRCDAVAVGRALLADPAWATKARSGQPARIRPCIGTVEGCAGMLQHGDPISCSVNADVGREVRPSFPPARAAPRRLVVIGAGPAGLEAARKGALKGHEVVIVDRADAIGGSLRLAAQTPPLRHVQRLADWFSLEMEHLDVDVRLRFEATAASVCDLDPGFVVVATGSVTEVPVLDGYDRMPVWSAEGLLAAGESTLGTQEPIGEIVVLGGGRRALATSLWLIGEGHPVVVVAGTRAGSDTSGLARRAYLSRIESAGGSVVRAIPRRLDKSGLVASAGDSEIFISCGGVVVADPARSIRPNWLDQLEAPFVVIGDARAPRGIGPAIAEGNDALRAMT